MTALRYVISARESGVDIEARSTLHGVRAHAGNLRGYVEALLDGEGAIGAQPAPVMHVEFEVEQLRSGNPFADREMWKLIDSKRFPRILADLTELVPLPQPGRYRAAGRITLAGRARTYQGELSVAADQGRLTIEGEVTVDIRDFGLKPPSLLMLKAEPVVRAALHAVAEQAA
jgi:polyisoprenoid-binding protein YceI